MHNVIDNVSSQKLGQNPGGKPSGRPILPVATLAYPSSVGGDNRAEIRIARGGVRKPLPSEIRFVRNIVSKRACRGSIH